jgi:hypothetical protein
MKADLIRIGNWRGVRIPKPMIEQMGLGATVELRVENDCLVISPNRHPRQGWREAFRDPGTAVNDELLLESSKPSEFDRNDWKY